MKQLEATIKESHSEDAEARLRKHIQEMEKLQDLERALLSDQLDALNTMLGRLVGWSVGWLVGWLASSLVGWWCFITPLLARLLVSSVDGNGSVDLDRE